GTAASGQAAALVPAGKLLACIRTQTLKEVEVQICDDGQVDLLAPPRAASRLGETGRQATRVSVAASGDDESYPAMPQLPAPSGVARSDYLADSLTRLAGCCSAD